MSDLVEKLRVLADPNRASHLGDLWNGLDEAADEIERLRDELTAERDKFARILELLDMAIRPPVKDMPLIARGTETERRIKQETIERCIIKLKETFSITPTAYSNKTLEQFVIDAVRAMEEKK